MPSTHSCHSHLGSSSARTTHFVKLSKDKNQCGPCKYLEKVDTHIPDDADAFHYEFENGSKTTVHSGYDREFYFLGLRSARGEMTPNVHVYPTMADGTTARVALEALPSDYQDRYRRLWKQMQYIKTIRKGKPGVWSEDSYAPYYLGYNGKPLTVGDAKPEYDSWRDR